MITINNETHCLFEWCEIYKINYATLYSRLKEGMDIINAIITPVEKRSKVKTFTPTQKQQIKEILENENN